MRIGSTQDSGKWWGRGELRGGGREEKSSKTQTCVTLWFFKSCRLCRLLVLHAGSFFFFFNPSFHITDCIQIGDVSDSLSHSSTTDAVSTKKTQLIPVVNAAH